MGLGKRGLGKILISLIIIVIVLIVAVLIYNLSVKKEELRPDPLSEQCAYFCETNQNTAFCSFKLVVNDNLRVTCNELLTNPAYSTYGVQVCPTISCTAQPEGNSQLAPDQTCTGLEGTWETPTTSGACPARDGLFVRKRTAEDTPPIDGQICCYYYQ